MTTRTTGGDLRLASAANGTALSTTAAFIQYPRVTNFVTITPRNFSTAVVARVIESPWLYVLQTSDRLTTIAVPGGNTVDHSENLQNAVATDVANVSGIPTAANGGYLYVGSYQPFRGVDIDVTALNTTSTSNLTVNYWHGAWTTISATDNTNSTESLDTDGTVVWTVPTDWKAASLVETGDTKLDYGEASVKLYWTRWQWSAALDAAVTIARMSAMNRSTAYWELTPGQAMEGSVINGPGGVSGIEALTDAGTANLVIMAGSSGRFQP